MILTQPDLCAADRFQDAPPPEVAVVDPAAFAVAGPDPRLPGPDCACPPLPSIRFAAAFEEA